MMEMIKKTNINEKFNSITENDATNKYEEYLSERSLR